MNKNTPVCLCSEGIIINSGVSFIQKSKSETKLNKTK